MKTTKKQLSKKIDTGNWKICGSHGFMYTGLDDPDYIKDKRELFKKHGNGWWYSQGCYRNKGEEWQKDT
jgi:hypothetical protein|tara:strand:- start:191 stop:397 length:207 start_codon:yes stop_codon:yes gene_type:complete